MPPPLIHHLYTLHITNRIRDIPPTQLPSGSHRQDEVDLLILRIRVILQQSGTKTRFHSRAGDHGPLLLVFGVKLQHALPTSPHGGVQAVEEPAQPALGADVGRLRVAQPLHGADADGSVEGAGSEGNPLAHVREEEVPSGVAVQRYGKHGCGYVHAYPSMAVIVEDLAREAGATADVEDEGIGVEVEDFETAGSHGGLDGLDS